MSLKKLFLPIFFITTTLAFCQNKEYHGLISEALKLYESKNFIASANKFTAAFKANGNKGLVYDRYNAACSWSLANKPDSAFVQLNKIAKNANFKDLEKTISDSDFISLHNDKRWTEVISIIKSNKEKDGPVLDNAIVNGIIEELNGIYVEDQKYRKQLDDIEKKYGLESTELKSQWKLIATKDSINLTKVTKILDERGWLGADIIGPDGNSTLFLVIQHSDLATQEKYLPMMRNAVLKGKADSSRLALLEDRVALGKGKRQIYGSQIGRNEQGDYYVLPLENPENVDKRRQEVGLGKLEHYISHWGLKWNVEEYKRMLPELEKNKN